MGTNWADKLVYEKVQYLACNAEFLIFAHRYTKRVSFALLRSVSGYSVRYVKQYALRIRVLKLA